MSLTVIHGNWRRPVSRTSLAKPRIAVIINTLGALATCTTIVPPL